MTLVKCKECGHEISPKAKTCPSCGAKNKRTSFIVIMGLFVLGIIILGNIFESPSSPTPPSPQTHNNDVNYDKASFEHVPKPKQLEVSSWSCYERRNYMIIEGEVKNISNFPIENLMIVGNFRKEDGTFIKSDNSLVEYNPLLPNQTSPFKVMSKHNPAISKCRISFKEVSGPKIPHRDLKSDKK